MKNVLKVLLIPLIGSILVLNACAKGERVSKTKREHVSETKRERVSETSGEGQGGDAAEQTGTYSLSETYDHVINGMRLIIAFDSQVNAFVGTVENTLTTTLFDVRVEVHQSNGIELGPTPRTDLRPGQKIPVQLDAVGTFNTWTAHPETGMETGHGGLEGSGESHRSSEGSGESHRSSEGSGESHRSSEGSGESHRSSEGSGESHGSGDRG